MAESKSTTDRKSGDEAAALAAAGSADATLPPWAPPPTLPPPPGDTNRARPHDPTLAVPDARTLPPPATGSTQAANSAPHDATLHTSDKLTRDFHKAAIAGAPKARTPGTAFGDYELIELIAKGGMGAVYKARQRKLNRIVAVKMILAGQFADQEDIDRFYAEAEAAANLRHPNIVAIHEVGVFEGQHFFSMDYIPGQ